MWEGSLVYYITYVELKHVFALNYVCLLTLNSEPTKYNHILHRTDRGSWSTAELSSHSHIQITNYVYKPTPEMHCGTWQDLYFLSLSPAIILASSISPPLPPSCPSCFPFSLLSLQSDQELILWILTLIQWDSYNPLSDYGATHTHAHTDCRHIQTHTCMYIRHIHASLKHTWR